MVPPSEGDPGKSDKLTHWLPTQPESLCFFWCKHLISMSIFWCKYPQIFIVYFQCSPSDANTLRFLSFTFDAHLVRRTDMLRFRPPTVCHCHLWLALKKKIRQSMLVAGWLENFDHPQSEASSPHPHPLFFFLIYPLKLYAPRDLDRTQAKAAQLEIVWAGTEQSNSGTHGSICYSPCW